MPLALSNESFSSTIIANRSTTRGEPRKWRPASEQPIRLSAQLMLPSEHLNENTGLLHFDEVIE
jgi:hypothetical protein